MKRQSWIEPKADISIKRQCVLASVCRATVYAKGGLKLQVQQS